MKPWGLPLVVLCGIALLQTAQPARAQGTAPKLDALLDRVSFNGTERPETLGKDLAEFDAGDLAKLCDMLVEPGTGDDTQPRMALHALTWYLGSAGTPAQRDGYIDVLCEALDSDKPPQVKAFLIRQLQLVGNDRAVPVLGRYLRDETLRAGAAKTLVAVGTDAALDALLRAARDGDGSTRLTVLTAIRQWPEGGALARLGDEVNAVFDFGNAEVPFVDRLALVTADDMEGTAERLLELLRDESRRREHRDEPWWYRTRTPLCALELADSLLEAKQRDLAARLYRGLMDSYDAPEEVYVRCAALHGLAKTLGAEAVDEVVAAMTDENPELRAAARELAVNLTGEGVTDAYVLQFYKAAPRARADILDVLRQRRDRAARSAALAGLKDEDKQVRLAAIAAAAELGREDAVEPFVAFLETADEDERRAVADALTRTPGDAVSSAIGQALHWHHRPDREAPYAIPLLLDVIAQRKVKWQLNTVYRWIGNSNEEIKVAAINAVGALADQRAAPRLLGLLTKAESEAVREALENALVATCQRADSLAERDTPILKATTRAIEQDDTREYCSLLRIAARLGSAEARIRLLVAAHEPRPEVKEAAIRAFNLWPDSSAAEAVLELADSQTDTKLHVLAMRAYLRMVGLDKDRPAAKTLRMYAGAMDVARRPEERKQVLSGLAEVKDVETLAVLSPYLDDEQLRAEAGSAMIGVARGLLPAGWAPARAALEKVIANASDERVRRHAEDVLKEVAQHEAFITDWQVSGPYKRGGKKGNELFDVAFPPEDPDAGGVEWKEQPVTKDPARYWFVDLTRSCGGSQPVGYLRTYIFSPEMQEVRLELGSDDGIKVWLNGEVIHANNVPRGCGRAQDKVAITLDEGWNELLLKIANIGGAWAASARVRTPDGEPVEGLKIDAHHKP